MDAKAMKKISQAYNGMQMGSILQVIVNAAMEGKTNITMQGIALDDGVEKYITGLGYQVDKKETSIIISW